MDLTQPQVSSHPFPSDSGMWRDDAGESASSLLIMACGSVLINLPCRNDLSLRKCEKAGNLQGGNVVWQSDGEMEHLDCGMSRPRREPFTSSFVLPMNSLLLGQVVVIHCKMTSLFLPRGSKGTIGANAFPDIYG